MAMNLATISAWLKSKNITAHSVAVGVIFVATAIVSDQDVRDYILKLFQNHPKIGTEIVALAAIILKYSNSRSPAGVMAASQVIEASPAPPTQAAIQAAKPSAQ
jgi:hypothetical protein